MNKRRRWKAKAQRHEPTALMSGTLISTTLGTNNHARIIKVTGLSMQPGDRINLVINGEIYRAQVK